MFRQPSLFFRRQNSSSCFSESPIICSTIALHSIVRLYHKFSYDSKKNIWMNLYKCVDVQLKRGKSVPYILQETFEYITNWPKIQSFYPHLWMACQFSGLCFSFKHHTQNILTTISTFTFISHTFSVKLAQTIFTINLIRLYFINGLQTLVKPYIFLIYKFGMKLLFNTFSPKVLCFIRCDNCWC